MGKSMCSHIHTERHFSPVSSEQLGAKINQASQPACQPAGCTYVISILSVRSGRGKSGLKQQGSETHRPHVRYYGPKDGLEL